MLVWIQSLSAFPFSAFNACQLEKKKRKEEILNVIATSVKTITNNISCDVQDHFRYSVTRWTSKANRDKPLPLVILSACLFLSLSVFPGPHDGPFWDESGLRKRSTKERRIESDAANLSTGGNHFTWLPLRMSSFIFRLEGQEKAYSSIHRHPDVPLASIWHVAFLPFHFMFLNDDWVM